MVYNKFMATFTIKSGEKIIVDDEYLELSKLAWQLNSVGYARRTIRIRGSGKYKTLLLHRFIMNAQDGMIVDHINGNKLDNRKANLRITTQSENLLNRHKRKKNPTSKYWGVYKHTERRWKTNKTSWRIQVLINGKRHRKSFESEKEAAIYRDKLLEKHNVQYAKYNFK